MSTISVGWRKPQTHSSTSLRIQEQVKTDDGNDRATESLVHENID